MQFSFGEGKEPNEPYCQQRLVDKTFVSPGSISLKRLCPYKKIPVETGDLATGRRSHASD
jgi:hypothetical protein